LGVLIRDGKITFNPVIFDVKELLEESRTFKYFDAKGNDAELSIPAGELIFTYCGVPIIYKRGHEVHIEVISNNDDHAFFNSPEISTELSQSVFNREGKIKQINVQYPF